MSSIEDLLGPHASKLRGALNHTIAGELKGIRLLMLTKDQLATALNSEELAFQTEVYLTDVGYPLRADDKTPLEVIKSIISNIEQACIRSLLTINLDDPWKRAPRSLTITRVVDSLEKTIGEPLTFENVALFTRFDIFSSHRQTSRLFNFSVGEEVNAFTSALRTCGYTISNK